MKKFLILAVLCLLASASPVSAQLIIHNNGNAELGVDPFNYQNPNLNPQVLNWLDTVTVLRIYGRYGNQAAGGHLTFGDTYLYNTYNVLVGELGYTDCDKLWLHGKDGTYLTANSASADTVMYYDPYVKGNYVGFKKDVHTSGVFVQSDERFKENVEPITDVLSSLDNLEAVSYTLKNDLAKSREAVASIDALTEKAQRDKEAYDKFCAENENGSERFGFLAQNVKEVFPELVHTDNTGYMYVDYIGLIPILVQSINELKAKVEELTAEKSDEETPLMGAPHQASQSELEASLGAAKLYQNAPNPWSSETVIRYSLPQNVAKADIYIYDMQGAQLKCIPAQGRGESQVTVTARDLKAGMYLYALVADGALVDSKQMILTK
jgi:hypothetical protein